MSTLHDVKSKIKLVPTLAPLLRTADANGVGVDTLLSHGVGVAAHVGASGDTLSGSIKAELALQHSDDNSAWVAVPDAEIKEAIAGAAQSGTFAVIDDNAKTGAIYKANYLGQKRYVRVIQNLVGTHTNGITIGAQVVLLPTQLPA